MKKSKSHEMLSELRDHTDNDNNNDDDDHDDDPSATVPEELTYLEEMRLAKMVRSENNRRLLLTSTSYRRGNNRGNGNGNGNSRGNNRRGQGGSRHLLSSNSNDNDDYNEGNDNGNGNSEGGRDGGSSNNDGAAKRRPSMLSSTRNIWHSMALCKEEDDDDDDDDDDDNAEKGGGDGKANKDGDDADDDNNDDFALDYGYDDIESIPYNDVDDSQVPKQQQQQPQPCKEISSRRSSMKMIRRQSNVSNAWKSMAKFIADDDDNYDTAIDDTNNSNDRRRSMISNASAWKSMAKFIDEDNHYETEANSNSSELGDPDQHHHDDGSSEGIPLYTRPVQRQLWGDPHLVVHIGWNTLFFDLFYVAAAYNLGNLLISVLNTTGGGDGQQQQLGRGLMYVIGIFGGIYNIFLRIMMYESQFSVPVDYSHRTVEVLRVFLLSIVVLHIKSLTGLRDPSQSIDAFAVTTSMFLETMVHVLLQLELYWVGEGDTLAIKNQTKRQLVTMLLPLSFFYFCGSILSGYLYYSNKHNQHNNTNNNHVDDEHYSAFDSDGYQRFLGGEEKEEEASGGSSDYTDDYDGWTVGDIPIVLCFVATVYSLVVKAIIAVLTLHPQNSHIRSQMVPMNIDFFIHRFGEFTMLFFGEAVMGLLIVETTDSSTYYGVAMLGVLTVVVLQAFKFESEPHGHDGGSDDHCLWRGMKCFFAYNLLTQVLCVGLIAFAVSFKVGLNYLVTTGSSSHTTSSSTSDESLSLLAATYGSVDYDSNSSTYYNNNNNDDNHSSRMLGGGGSVSVSTDVIAILYCVSLTLILTSIELMGYSHQGLIKTYALFFSDNDESNNNNNEQQRQRRRSMVNWKVLFGTLFKLGLLVCVATLYLWIDQLDVLAGVGFLISIIFASSKVIEHLLVTKKHKVKKIVNSVSKRMSYNNKKSAEKKISALSVTEKEFSAEDLNQTDTGIVFSDK